MLCTTSASVAQHRAGPNPRPLSAPPLLSRSRVCPCSLRPPYVPRLAGQKKDASAGKTGKGVPWFAFGFIGVAAVNSIWGIAPSLQKLFTTLSAGFLASAMAALGLDTDLVKVKSLGWKPIALAMALWVNLIGAGFLVSRFLVASLV